MTSIKLISAAISLAIPGCVASPAHAADLVASSFPDRGRSAVVDGADVIPAAQEKALNDQIVTWVGSSGHQLAVVTVPDLGGLGIKSYGYQLGRKWGLGDAQRKDGVILLLAPSARKVRIEVGYGLEPVLTDAATGKIVSATIVPRLRAGDVPGALSAGADAIMSIASAEPVAAMTAVDHSRVWGWSPWWWSLPVAMAVAAALLLAYRRRRADPREAEATSTAAAARYAQPPRTEPVRRGGTTVAPDADPSVVEIDPIGGYRRWRPRESGDQVEQASAAGRLDNTRRSFAAPSSPSVPAYVPPVYEAPRRRDDDTPSSSFSSPSDWGSSSSPSGDTGSSSGGYDSGGGSFGGGGSDSSY
ncbi:TPM domain-containing protein [Sphingomonas aquatilis]